MKKTFGALAKAVSYTVVGAIAMNIACFVLLTILANTQVMSPSNPAVDWLFEASIVFIAVFAGYYGEKYDRERLRLIAATTAAAALALHFLISGALARRSVYWTTGALVVAVTIAVLVAWARSLLRRRASDRTPSTPTASGGN